MILVAFVIAFFISSFVTKSLDAIGKTIKQTRLTDKNIKIENDNTPKEVVCESHNTMIDKLKSSAVKPFK